MDRLKKKITDLMCAWKEPMHVEDCDNQKFPYFKMYCRGGTLSYNGECKPCFDGSVQVNLRTFMVCPDDCNMQTILDESNEILNKYLAVQFKAIQSLQKHFGYKVTGNIQFGKITEAVANAGNHMVAYTIFTVEGIKPPLLLNDNQFNLDKVGIETVEKWGVKFANKTAK